MYVYFDEYGVIKEIVSVDPARVGSSANKIYVYFADEPELDHLWWVMKKFDETLTLEKDIVLNVEYKALPYNVIKDRDLKYFKDYETYKFYVITLSSSDLNVSGLALLTLRAVIDDELYAKGLLTFNIENSVIKEDNNITQSQYDYLLTIIDSVEDYGYFELNDELTEGDLTLLQLADCQKKLCVIKYGGDYFIKTNFNDVKLLFVKIPTFATSSGIVNWDDKTIEIDLEQETWEYEQAQNQVYNKSQADTLLGQKQDTLVNQSNIKSVNGSSLLGSGDLDTNNVGIVKKSIGSSTVSLSDSEIAELQKDYAIIVDTSLSDKPVYIKTTTTSSQIEFRRIHFYQYTNNWFAVNQSTLAVNLTNKTVHKLSLDKSIYDKNQVDTLISGLSNLSLKREIVASLPVSDISANTIYMILDNAGQGANVYNEYLYVNNNWELLGTSKLDYKLYDLGSTLTDKADIIAQLRNATSQCVLKYTYNYDERFYYERYRHPTTPYTLYFESIEVRAGSVVKYVLSNTISQSSTFTHDVYQYPYLQGLVENWRNGASYVVGDLVCYNSKLYKCNANHTSGGSFDTTKFDETDLETLLNGKLNASRFGFIEINTSSGTLTQEQQDEAHKDFCVIHDTSSDFYYIKSEYDYGVDITFRFIRKGMIETLVVDETDGSYSITTEYLQTYKHTITFTNGLVDWEIIIHSKRRTAYTITTLTNDLYNGDGVFVAGSCQDDNDIVYHIFSLGFDANEDMQVIIKQIGNEATTLITDELSLASATDFTDTLSAL